MTPDRVQAAVRAYTVLEKSDRKTPHEERSRSPWPASVLCADLETTVDTAQRLLIGSYRYCEWTPGGRLECLEEGIIYADDLEQHVPGSTDVLRTYVRTHRPDCAPQRQRRLRLYSRTAFLDRVLLPLLKAGGMVVNFNLPFDLTRLAKGWGRARGSFAGGFSFWLWEYQTAGRGRNDDRYRPRIRIKHLDSKRSFIGVGGSRVPTAYGADPQFLDLRTLVSALTNESHSLNSALTAFGVPYQKLDTTHGVVDEHAIDYNRHDVKSTLALLEAVRREYDRHPVALLPARAYSPASIAVAYLTAMGLKPPLEKANGISRDLLGAAMSAYFGGRAECRIRRTAVPVVYCDFMSMYPTVNTLMGLWPILIAERITMVDATSKVRALLQTISLERCFDPSMWREFTFFALVDPQDDILPLRARYEEVLRGEEDEDPNDPYTIGVNPVRSPVPLCYAGPDLVAARLLTGRPPRILRAVRLMGEGRQAGLTAVKLRGTVSIDPVADDFFKYVATERYRAKRDHHLEPDERTRLVDFLKVLANSGSYGKFAQMDRREVSPRASKANARRKRSGVALRVHGRDGSFVRITRTPEVPGRFCFPPVAALISAGARLMLAMLERCVTDVRGTYAFSDTDSMAIVATERGGRVEPLAAVDDKFVQDLHALSFAEVDAIAERFRSLSPYDPEIVTESILKIEDENYADTGAAPGTKARRQLYAFVVSAKRYCLFNLAADGTYAICKASEHGLGHLLDPHGLEEEGQ